MPTQLNQVLSFTGVAAGATSALAHNININATPVLPDLVFRDNGDFSIVSVTTTTVTVRNDGAVQADLNVWLWRQHTFDRAYGGSGTTNLSPQPFVPAAGGAGGAGGSVAFRYIVTGLEPDTSDFMVTLPAPQLADTYKVQATLAGVVNIVGIDCPDIVAGDRTLTQFRVVTTFPMTAGDQIDFLVTE